MPNTQQAKKAIRQDQKRGARNLKINQDLKTLLKKTRKAIDAKESKDKIDEMLKKIQKSIDKAVQKGMIKKSTGSRKLSRIMAYNKKGGQIVNKEETPGVKKEEIKENKE